VVAGLGLCKYQPLLVLYLVKRIIFSLRLGLGQAHTALIFSLVSNLITLLSHAIITDMPGVISPLR
jgi:hypothetical protein